MKFKIYRVVKENDSFLNIGLEVQYVTRSDGTWKDYYLSTSSLAKARW